MKNKKLLILFVLFLLSVLNCYSRPKVVVISVDAAITPSTKSFIEKGINHAEQTQASLLIIKLNTPGGLLESTREIIQKMLGSSVPIAVYVAPQGSRAGSAGVFITLAANIAVMAPGTNIGAAHPVGLQGQSDSGAMFQKVTNDAAAFIRSIAEKRHRNPLWAERSVRESISASESEALRDSVIDFVTTSVDSLLILINGREAETSAGKVVINTLNAETEQVEMSWKDELLKLITNPNIAYILLMIGFYGILFEFFSPGSIFPGVIGGICLILAAYSLQMLPVNYAGLALIILSVILFLLEIKIISHGVLTIGGVISLVIGSIMLIDAPEEFMSISLSLIITVVVLTVLFFTFVLGLGIKAQFFKRQSGKDGLIGEEGIALADFSSGQTGKIKLKGEIWNAESENDIKEGQKVEVIKTVSLTLIVKPK